MRLDLRLTGRASASPKLWLLDRCKFSRWSQRLVRCFAFWRLSLLRPITWIIRCWISSLVCWSQGTVSDFTEYQTLVNVRNDFWSLTVSPEFFEKKKVLAIFTWDLEPLLSEVEVSGNDDAKIFFMRAQSPDYCCRCLWLAGLPT